MNEIDENCIGQRVFLSATKKFGTLMFLGETLFASGIWVGVCLDTDEGKNDGSIDGHKYFECKPLHGIFVRKVDNDELFVLLCLFIYWKIILIIHKNLNIYVTLFVLMLFTVVFIYPLRML